MTREDIIRMARKAELAYGPDEKPLESVLCFAALVAAHEREECAKVAETPIYGEQDDITMAAKDRIAATIRARGEK